jgi:hypothetical protein
MLEARTRAALCVPYVITSRVPPASFAAKSTPHGSSTLITACLRPRAENRRNLASA